MPEKVFGFYWLSGNGCRDLLTLTTFAFGIHWLYFLLLSKLTGFLYNVTGKQTIDFFVPPTPWELCITNDKSNPGSSSTAYSQSCEQRTNWIQTKMRQHRVSRFNPSLVFASSYSFGSDVYCRWEFFLGSGKCLSKVAGSKQIVFGFVGLYISRLRLFTGSLNSGFDLCLVLFPRFGFR